MSPTSPSSLLPGNLLTWLVGWKVVLGLTARLDSTCISVYIEPTPKEKEKEKKNHRGEKKCPNHTRLSFFGA